MGNYSRPIQEVLDRLAYHTADLPGRMLRGLRYVPTPVVEVTGLTDLPCVALYVPKLRENYVVRRVSGQLSWSLIVAVRRQSEQSNAVVTLMEWIEKVLDAIETRADGSEQVNTNIGGTTKPFEAAQVNAFALDLSINAEITLSIEPRPCARGSRRE